MFSSLGAIYDVAREYSRLSLFATRLPRTLMRVLADSRAIRERLEPVWFRARHAKRSHGPLRNTHWSLAEVAFSFFQTLETPRNEAKPQGTFRGESFSHRNVHCGEGWGVTAVFASYLWRYEFNKKFGLGWPWYTSKYLRKCGNTSVRV